MRRGFDIVNNYLNIDKRVMIVQGDNFAAAVSACR
jgi:hypothetical protein